MSADQPETEPISESTPPASTPSPGLAPETLEGLANGSAAERTLLIRALIAANPEGRLILAPLEGRPVVLEEIDLRAAPGETPICLRGADLRGVKLRHAKLSGVDLSGADLREASMGGVDLRRANLQGADLRGADLAGAKFCRAELGGADFRESMLEEADLREAKARFAKFNLAELEHADLRRADLWGALLGEATLCGADLRQVILTEADLQKADLSSADLRNAVLGRADLTGAKLNATDLREASCAGATFLEASLREANLQGLDLSNSVLTGVHLAGARLDQARFRRSQLGEALGEELSGELDTAREGYLALERSFAAQGDHDAAVWAYLRRRRMQKQSALARAKAARAEGRKPDAFRNYAQFASDEFVEWVCDYGESVPRVMRSLLVLYLAFTLTYGLTGSVTREEKTPAGTVQVVSRNIEDVAIFSLLAMSTGDTGDRLKPTHDLSRTLVGIHVFVWVALTGLMGFVLGNRIRR